ncbi:hypothetical protein AVEN_137334-1 [Araneus ventricosus]|uniref:Uncharacterized protein n=1 Tax=Araneus ventricosus TaxID=182803 RepID=A0A4Y2FIC8_ARAVE|nr:hypothetical protein AVEN_137334-1 [Araneus ventricosus]
MGIKDTRWRFVRMRNLGAGHKDKALHTVLFFFSSPNYLHAPLVGSRRASGLCCCCCYQDAWDNEESAPAGSLAGIGNFSPDQNSW